VRQELVEQAVLLPVKLADPVTPTGLEASPARTRAPAGVIEIDIGAARVRLRGSVDEANLRCALHTLRASA
jgi:transposase